MEKYIAEISKEFPCRQKLLKELYQFYGHPNHRLPSSVYLYGPAGIGKSSILLRVLEYCGITYASMDCIEYYTSKMFYESIVNMFHGHQLTQENNFANFATCDSTESFLDEMTALGKSKPKQYVLVLRNYNRLQSMDPYVLPVLMRFNALVPALNFSCVLIGSKFTTQHNSSLGNAMCHNIRCENYTKSELMEILQLQIQHLERTMRKLVNDDRANRSKKAERLAIIDELGDEFYCGYFNVFLNTFFFICRNVKELLYLSNANFPIYCKPVIDGHIQKTEQRKLWKNIELPFKTAMGTIYCRVDNVDAKPSENDAMSTEIAVSSTTRSSVQQLELPFYTKYLLIAAYLASHNDAKIDKRLFMKNHGKQRKRLQNVRAKAVVSDKLSTQVGPKSFNIDRLMAIFYAINENKVPLTANLLMQITNLVRLKYLTFVSGENNVMDGSARLQCIVTLDFISLVGKQVGFNVRQYLCDFM